MATITFLDMVSEALPSNIEPKELMVYGKPEWWRNNQKLACAYALRKHPSINWKAYLTNYPDVGRGQIDPVLHFIRRGVYEGRKLKSWDTCDESYVKLEASRPKVSVLVASYNNSIFLEKCLNSLITQSLKDIEVIIVDDCSTDNSLAIAYGYAERDNRVRVIAHDKNKNLLMARKTGVAAATGEYVMFLDADDFYSPEACQVAYEAVIKGHDVGNFNANCIGHYNSPNGMNYWPSRFCGKSQQEVYTREEVIQLAFFEGIMPWNICFKIIKRELAQQAYNDLEDCDLYYSEDVYTFLAVVCRCHSLIHIEKRLYNNSVGSGVTTDLDRSSVSLLHGDHLPLVERLCAKYNLHSLFHVLKRRYTDIIMDTFVLLPIDMRPSIFKKYSDKLGIEYMLKCLMEKHVWKDMSFLASLIPPARETPRGARHQVKKVGILFKTLRPGGVERTIQNICRLLPKLGYEITLYLADKYETELDIAPGIRRYYLGDAAKNRGKDNVQALLVALRESTPDIAILMGLNGAEMPWRILLLRMLNIPIIGSLRIDHCDGFIERGTMDYDGWLAFMRVLDKLFCLNTTTEAYLRAQGVDAVYIPNPIREFDREIPQVKTESVIAVLARLSEPRKKLGHCLRTLVEVMKKKPGVKMLFIGDFESSAHKQEFYAKAKALGVRANISVSGWVDDPGPLLDKAKILFSASLLEGFPNGIAEAQARGLPVVAYDLDIVIRQDNDSIIMVPQDDFRAAAAAICKLLDDEEELKRLSLKAREKATEYTSVGFVNGLADLFHNFDKQSPWHPFVPADYQRTLRYAAFYASQSNPPFCAI